MNKNGIIVWNAFAPLLSQPKRIQEELKLLGIDIPVVRNDEVLAYINGDKCGNKLSPDFVIYLDKDVHIAQMLEKCGMRLFNSSKSIFTCDDKVLTYIALTGHNIKMPVTISSPLCYTHVESPADTFTKRVVEKLGFPMVAKSNFGSLGQQVYLLDNIQKLKSFRNKYRRAPHLYQEYIKCSHGRDVRIIVIDGKAVASMLRISDNDFRSNIALGGKPQKFDAPAAFTDMAEQAAQIIGLDYCGVDILFGESGEPILCEVNSNAYFETIEKLTGINIARKYAEYIIKKTNR